MVQDRHSAAERGVTLPEMVVAVLVLVTVLVPLGNVFLSSVNAFSSLAKRAQVAAQVPVVMDRIVTEMTNGRFTSLDPPVPDRSTWIRFQKITGIVANLPVYSDPIQIELVPHESSNTDGVDNDGDGIVDEGAIRVWQDAAPYSTTPGIEDSPVIIATGIAKDGLQFTREGATIVIDIAFEYVADRGEPPVIFRLQSAVLLRNNN